MIIYFVVHSQYYVIHWLFCVQASSDWDTSEKNILDKMEKAVLGVKIPESGA